MADFAKLVRLEDGTQALCYMEPDGDAVICHHVFDFEFGQVDVKLTLCGEFSEEDQQGRLDRWTPEDAALMKEITECKFLR